jgi:hypothetical protein
LGPERLVGWLARQPLAQQLPPLVVVVAAAVVAAAVVVPRHP